MEIVQAKDPSLVFSAKTLTDEVRLEFIQNSIIFYHLWVVPRVGRSGGLVHYWRLWIYLTIKGLDRNYIDAIVDKDLESEWHLTGFYGEPKTARRNEAWDKLRSLSSRLESPWLCCGDFNEIIRQDEKLEGATRSHNQMQLFKDVIDECGFMDFGFEGSKYTWSRHYENDNSIWERLDQCLATNNWFLKFPSSRVYHLRCESSYYNQLHIVLSDLDPPIKKKLFYLVEIWLSNTGCEEVVHLAWNSFGDFGYEGEILTRVDKCGKDLNWWNKNVENAALFSGNNSRVRQLKKEIDVPLDRESTMWAQRSRLLWARQGDKNTKYFNSCATWRYRKKCD